MTALLARIVAAWNALLGKAKDLKQQLADAKAAAQKAADDATAAQLAADEALVSPVADQMEADLAAFTADNG